MSNVQIDSRYMQLGLLQLFAKELSLTAQKNFTFFSNLAVPEKILIPVIYPPQFRLDTVGDRKQTGRSTKGVSQLV